MHRHMLRYLLLVTVLGAATACGAERAVGIVVCGQRLSGGAQPYFSDKTLMGPVAECAQLAGAKAAWDPASGVMVLTSASGERVTVRKDSGKLAVGDRTVQLGRVAVVRGGRLYAPIALVLQALGCRTEWSQKAYILYANGVLEDLEVLAGPRGARVRIETSTPLKATLQTMEAPPRCYVDLPGITLPKGEETRYIYTGPLARVRTGVRGDGAKTVRVVADLGKKAQARWEATDGRLSGAMEIGAQDDDLLPVERNLPHITGVSCRQPAKGQERLQVTLDWPVEATWDLLGGPARICLTFPETVSLSADSTMPLDGEFVDRVEVRSQRTPPVTTATAYLRELVQFEFRRLEGGGADVLFRREALADKCVVLDAGHGGHDDGASGRVLKEKDVNLDVAMRASRKLRDMGATAYLTRSDDTFIDLHDRPRAARGVGADLFVSVHCNAMPKRNCGVGTETFYHWRESKCLGLVMQDSLVQALKRPDRGLKQANFVVIRESEMPAVLVELMFLNSDTEEALLQQDQTRDAAAGAIVEGLRRYVEGSLSTPRELTPGAGLTRLGALPSATSLLR